MGVSHSGCFPRARLGLRNSGPMPRLDHPLFPFRSSGLFSSERENNGYEPFMGGPGAHPIKINF
eukprot:10880657-Karenia_brevis.AAC.1